MKSKSLSVSPSSALCAKPSPDPAWLDKSVGKLREYHGIAMNAANQAVAAAIFAGLELKAVQKNLRNCHSGSKDSAGKLLNFEEWLSANEQLLGFSVRTAFRYLKLADGIKSKLKDQAPELDRLLSFAPSQMSATQAKALLQALHKSVDGESLNDLYLDFGIVKPTRRFPHNSNPANNGSDHEGSTVTVEEKVQMQLDLFGQYSLSLDQTISEGGAKILLISKWPKPRLDEAIKIAKRNLTLLVKVRGAIK
jgi:hypothetical protein